MKLPLVYFEHLDFLRLGHAKQLMSWGGFTLVRLSVLLWTL